MRMKFKGKTMIRNNICFRDYETGSKNKFKCQPVQIAAVMIDIKRLEVIPDSLFESTMRPELDDDKAIEMGLDPIEDEALKINGFTREELVDAPETKLVWSQYLEYLSDYNLKGKSGSKWDAPAIAGYNNRGFDDYIDIRLCEKYGPKLDEWGGWSMYHPFYNFDVQSNVQDFFHNIMIGNGRSIGMDAMREFMGYSTENAHKADVDVMQGADMLIRFLKLIRGIVDGSHGLKIKFKDCAKGTI